MAKLIKAIIYVLVVIIILFALYMIFRDNVVRVKGGEVSNDCYKANGYNTLYVSVYMDVGGIKFKQVLAQLPQEVKDIPTVQAKIHELLDCITQKRCIYWTIVKEGYAGNYSLAVYNNSVWGGEAAEDDKVKNKLIMITDNDVISPEELVHSEVERAKNTPATTFFVNHGAGQYEMVLHHYLWQHAHSYSQTLTKPEAVFNCYCGGVDANGKPTIQDLWGVGGKASEWILINPQCDIPSQDELNQVFNEYNQVFRDVILNFNDRYNQAISENKAIETLNEKIKIKGKQKRYIRKSNRGRMSILDASAWNSQVINSQIDSQIIHDNLQSEGVINDFEFPNGGINDEEVDEDEEDEKEYIKTKMLLADVMNKFHKLRLIYFKKKRELEQYMKKAEGKYENNTLNVLETPHIQESKKELKVIQSKLNKLYEQERELKRKIKEYEELINSFNI